MRLSGKCVAFCDIGVISVFKVEVYSKKSVVAIKWLPIFVCRYIKELFAMLDSRRSADSLMVITPYHIDQQPRQRDD